MKEEKNKGLWLNYSSTLQTFLLKQAQAFSTRWQCCTVIQQIQQGGWMRKLSKKLWETNNETPKDWSEYSTQQRKPLWSSTNVAFMVRVRIEYNIQQGECAVNFLGHYYISKHEEHLFCDFFTPGRCLSFLKTFWVFSTMKIIKYLFLDLIITKGTAFSSPVPWP